LHYLLPFVIAALIITHLALLHVEGSSDPIGLAETPSKLTFQPYFTYKDLFVLMLTLSGFFFLSLFVSNFLGHSDNFIPANPLVTPAHIVPEWYFTPFYAILRSCPNKLGGALGMFSAIIILFVLPFLFNVGAANKKISLVARSYAGLM
jgi:ubiquinol-cytochrome c reductase cytochrome b subunit